MKTVVRPVETDDYDGMVRCLDRNAMEAWSRSRWLSLWDDYPYRREFEGVPRGFVLEVDGAIVGSTSSIWAKYSLGGRELRAIFGANTAVDPVHRSGSIRLIGEQLSHRGVDIYFNASASATTSKVMDTLKVPRVPQPDNDLVLLWAVNGRRVARAGLARRRTPLAGVIAWPAGLGLTVASKFKLRRVARGRHPVAHVKNFHEEFDHLWSALRARTQKLIGFRDSDTLTWRYAHKIASGDATILTVRRGGVLAGYAVLVRTQRPSLGLVANSIQDLQCADDDPALVTSLLTAAWGATRDAGIDLLEWAGFTGDKRAIAERASPLSYRLDVWQAFYYTRDPALKSTLLSPACWDVSGYDCD